MLKESYVIHGTRGASWLTTLGLVIAQAHSIGGDGNDTARSNVGDDTSATFYCEIVSKLNSAS